MKTYSTGTQKSSVQKLRNSKMKSGLIALSLLLSTVASLPAQEFRTWTDDRGRTLDAMKLIGVRNNGTAELEVTEEEYVEKLKSWANRVVDWVKLRSDLERVQKIRQEEPGKGGIEAAMERKILEKAPTEPSKTVTVPLRSLSKSDLKYVLLWMKAKQMVEAKEKAERTEERAAWQAFKPLPKTPPVRNSLGLGLPTFSPTSVPLLREEEYREKVEESKVPVVLEFFADWAPPSEKVGKVVEELAAESGDSVRVFRVDVESQPNLVERFSLQTIPAILFFRNGEIKAKFNGSDGFVTDKEKYLEVLKRLTQ